MSVTHQQTERFLRYLGRIASAMEKRNELDYPAKKEPRDAVISHLPNHEDKLKEELLGDPAETIEEWIGSREKEWVSKKGDQEEAGGDEAAGGD